MSVWQLGEQSLSRCVAVVSDSALYSNPDTQQAAAQGVFELCLSMVIDAGQEHKGKALNGIVSLLKKTPDRLKNVVDADSVAILLECLDIRSPSSHRRGALTAIKLLLDLTGDEGQRYLRDFVTTRVNQATNEDLIVAFSAASATFPILPTHAAQLFLTDGFLQKLMPKLLQNSVEREHSNRLEQAALELLSAACQDKACRAQIAKLSTGWLEDVAEGGLHPESACLAALVLSKLYQVERDGQVQGPFRDAEQLTVVLGNMLLNADTDSEKGHVAEGLSYVAIEGVVRDKIVSNKALLKALIACLGAQQEDMTIALAVVSTLALLVQYRPKQSEEEKKMTRLKA